MKEKFLNDLYSHLEPLSPSEKKRIANYHDSKIHKILYTCRSEGNYLMIFYERIRVRKTEKHEPPFKYVLAIYGKRGGCIRCKVGNVWDEEYNCIMDDFTITK